MVRSALLIPVIYLVFQFMKRETARADMLAISLRTRRHEAPPKGCEVGRGNYLPRSKNRDLGGFYLTSPRLPGGPEARGFRDSGPKYRAMDGALSTHIYCEKLSPCYSSSSSSSPPLALIDSVSTPRAEMNLLAAFSVSNFFSKGSSARVPSTQ